MFNHVPIEVGKLVQVNAKGGRYYETPSGAKYPSVTSVTRLHNLESIQAWKDRVGEEEAGKISRRALARGNKIHSLAEKYLLNEGDSLLFNEGRDPTLSIQQSKRASAHYAAGQDLCNPEISPLFGSFYGIPAKVLISSGTRDLLLSQSVQLASLLREFGVDVDLRIRDGLWHVYEWDAELPEAIASIRQAAEFIQNSIS